MSAGPTMAEQARRPGWAVVACLVAVSFGIATVIVGGRTLFGGPAVREAAGNIVPFVLWFNFAAGFAYIVAGLGLLLWKRWAAQVSIAIAVATLLVFAAFGVHIWTGGAFELRTMVAMTGRSVVWVIIAAAANRALTGARSAASRPT